MTNDRVLLTERLPSSSAPLVDDQALPPVAAVDVPAEVLVDGDFVAQPDWESITRGSRPRRRLWLLVADTWAGLRDGRRGLPVVDGHRAFGTPRLAEIHRECQAHLDRLRRAVIAAGAADSAREVVLAADILPRAQERLADAERRLEAARLAGITAGRRLGEDDLPSDLVERRRVKEASRRVSRAMTQVEDERAAVRKAHGELEGTRGRLQHRTHEAFAQAEQVHAWASRRATRYLTAAQRRHPDRAAFAGAFAALLPPPPTRDQWLTAIQLETP